MWHMIEANRALTPMVFLSVVSHPCNLENYESGPQDANPMNRIRGGIILRLRPPPAGHSSNTPCPLASVSGSVSGRRQAPSPVLPSPPSITPGPRESITPVHRESRRQAIPFRDVPPPGDSARAANFQCFSALYNTDMEFSAIYFISAFA